MHPETIAPRSSPCVRKNGHKDSRCRGVSSSGTWDTRTACTTAVALSEKGRELSSDELRFPRQLHCSRGRSSRVSLPARDPSRPVEHPPPRTCEFLFHRSLPKKQHHTKFHLGCWRGRFCLPSTGILTLPRHAAQKKLKKQTLPDRDPQTFVCVSRSVAHRLFRSVIGQKKSPVVCMSCPRHNVAITTATGTTATPQPQSHQNITTASHGLEPSSSTTLPTAAAVAIRAKAARAHPDVHEAGAFPGSTVRLCGHAPLRAQLVVPRRPHGGVSRQGGGGVAQGPRHWLDVQRHEGRRAVRAQLQPRVGQMGGMGGGGVGMRGCEVS